MKTSDLKILRKELTDAINEALRNTKTNLNLKFEGIGNISYNDSGCSFKVKIDDVSAALKTSSTGSYVPSEFQRSAFLLGMPEATYGAVIEIRGKHYKLVELKSSAPKFPFVAECVETKGKYKLPMSYKQAFIDAAN